MKPITVKKFAKMMNDLLRSKQIKPNDKIYLSCDEEGNWFYPLGDNAELALGIQDGKVILFPSEGTIHNG